MTKHSAPSVSYDPALNYPEAAKPIPTDQNRPAVKMVIDGEDYTARMGTVSDLQPGDRFTTPAMFMFIEAQGSLPAHHIRTVLQAYQGGLAFKITYNELIAKPVKTYGGFTTGPRYRYIEKAWHPDTRIVHITPAS